MMTIRVLGMLSDGNPFRDGTLSLLVVFLLLASGCSTGDYAHDIPLSNGAKNAGRSAVSPVSHGSDENKVTLQHDFQLLLPGEQRAHTFVIANESNRGWSIAKIEHDCACVVSTASSDVIRAGETEEIEIAYRAPPRLKDDERRVLVRLKERDAPLIELVLRANIRPALCIVPAELDFGRVGFGCTLERAIEIFNFTDDDFVDFKVETQSDCLKARVVSVPVASASLQDPRPQQAWRALIDFAAAKGMTGRESSLVQFYAETPDTEPLMSHLPVRVYIEPPIVSIPGQLFFGQLEPQSEATRSVLVRFADNLVPVGERTQLRHNLQDRLKLSWRRESDSTWRMTAQLLPEDGDRWISGEVEILDVESGERILRVPVSAIAK